MCTKGRKTRTSGGFLLSETLVAFGVVALLVLAVVSFSMFSSRSFAALFNYVELDDHNRIAIDQITRDVRQANRVKEATSTRLVLEEAGGGDLTYQYNSSQRTLVRIQGADTKVILKECDRLTFSLGQRNTVSGSYDVYPVATSPSTIKVVNVAWLCSRSIFGNKENTESVQTARIVIRKQGT